jgi:hypothetical protein
MTTSELKRAMDRRFDRLERTSVDRTEFREAMANLRAGVRNDIAAAADRLTSSLRGEIGASAVETRRYVDATSDRLAVSLRDEITASAAETRRYVDVTAANLREEIARLAAETRRHFDVVAEGIRRDRHSWSATNRFNTTTSRVVRSSANTSGLAGRTDRI